VSHEVFLYVFDATMMSLAVLVMNVAHPGEVATHVRERKDREAGKSNSRRDNESGTELMA
jgi:hypothetical protein